jgi:ataxin-3
MRVSTLHIPGFAPLSAVTGYSVFVVMQSDPDAPLALPRTDADDIASTIPEQASAPSSSSRISTSRTTANTLGFEDDVELQAALQDMDLQAALQASLMAHTEGVHSESGLESPLPLPVPPPLMSSAETRSWRPMASRSQTPTQVRSPAELDEAEDPVAATMARNRSIMQRMRMEQETALRESYEDIDMEQLRSRQRQSQEEEDMIQRAIAESEALHPLSRSAQDDAMAAEGDGPQPRSPPLHPQEESRRVYDDEDEELQAALRASLEDVPEGYRATLESPPPRMVPPPAPSHEWDPPNATNSAKEPDADDSEVWSETSSIASPEEEQITMEEMRRRRLAKFGA